MRYVYHIALFSLAILLAGCGTTVKNKMQNFTAYFNTFYNAKKNFRNGLEKVKEQEVTINPEQPIRIHVSPVNAAQQDFENAIQKGAKILRKHPDTKWVDDALMLIGKSYYYKQEYFSADQKFRELYTNAQTSLLKQKSVKWRGRVSLEMELYSQCISYLENELGNIEKWNPTAKAEVRSLLAECYTNLQQWEEANSYLLKAIPKLEDSDHKARAYFLHGQVLERLDRLEEAYGAYKQVPSYHPAYDLVYHANRKQAEISRQSGNLDRAYRIFVEMSKDDKNFSVLPELKYEIARTEQERRNYKRAEQIYKEVLHDYKKQPSKVTIAKTYHGLAELYRRNYDNFETAAAYYDSAAAQSVGQEKLPQNFQAEQLAQSFGDYARLKREMADIDSLMWLGGLSESKFDSVLARIKEKRRKKLKKEKKDRKNTMVNVSGPSDRSTQQNQDPNSGFLNVRNPKRVAQAKREFEAYWGNRPLVDNWRRVEGIRQVLESSDSTSADTDIEEIGKPSRTEDQELQRLNIDMEKIPFSQEARQEMEREKARKKYELANVFFLSLNMPDSAVTYYQNIITQYPDTADVVPQAMYSLSELYYIEGNKEKARELGERLMEKYPKTEYTRRIADRYGIALQRKEPKQSSSDSLKIHYQRKVDSLSSIASRYKAEDDSLYKGKVTELAESRRKFALNNKTNEIAPYALLDAARNYMEIGRLDSSYKAHAPDWFDLKISWEQKQESFQSKKDSLRHILSDSTLAAQADTAEVKKELNALQDSTLQPPDFHKHYPYKGTYWDSARSVLAQLNSTFNTFDKGKQVDNMVEELKPPEKKKEKKTAGEKSEETEQSVSKAKGNIQQSPKDGELPEKPEEGRDEQDRGKRSKLEELKQSKKGQAPQDSVSSTGGENANSSEEKVKKGTGKGAKEEIKTCKELNVTPKIVGGKEAFIKKVKYPEKLQQMTMEGEAKFHITVDTAGQPVSANAATHGTGLGINKALKVAILKDLDLEPVKVDGKPVKAKCTLTFPVRLNTDQD